jgi:hypothetical protein
MEAETAVSQTDLLTLFEAPKAPRPKDVPRIAGAAASPGVDTSVAEARGPGGLSRVTTRPSCVCEGNPFPRGASGSHTGYDQEHENGRSRGFCAPGLERCRRGEGLILGRPRRTDSIRTNPNRGGAAPPGVVSPSGLAVGGGPAGRPRDACPGLRRLETCRSPRPSLRSFLRLAARSGASALDGTFSERRPSRSGGHHAFLPTWM